MRIWYQSMTEIGRYPAYRESIEAHARQVLSDDVQVDVFGVREGTYGGYAPIELLTYPYPSHVLLDQVLDSAAEAEAAGYDAFVIGSFSEPFLREVRSLAQIPVVAMGESTLLVACSYGHGIGLVTINPPFAYMTRRLVEKHGLSERVAGIAALDPPVTEDNLADAFADADELIARFQDAALPLLEQHADVIVPGEGVLNEFLFTNGVRDVHGASVVDSVAVTLLYAQMQVRLWQDTGLRPGRQWEYRRPNDDILAAVQRFRQASRTPHAATDDER